ncbi:MAG: helix-turn-helix domain-containing protein [Lachnospiraceae bacterium]|nr:helix-turn-helix domain-containing protein [Lachnospiraceae bacterium]
MNNMELLADALDYMESHLSDDIHTEDVARACYCSKSTLEKLFRCVNKITVREYLIQRRMTKAAKAISAQPETGILEIALQYGYSTNESFTRAFKQVWNCKPSEFRNRKYTELFPRLRMPLEEGDEYVKKRKPVDISELYDLFVERRKCCFVCCDVASLTPINQIARKAGDLAILETLRRMNEAAGEDDIVFRIGGDEFTILTCSEDESYAQALVDKIKEKNGQTFDYEDRKIPLKLHAGIAKFSGSIMRYNDLFAELHTALKESKRI